MICSPRLILTALCLLVACKTPERQTAPAAAAPAHAEASADASAAAATAPPTAPGVPSGISIEASPDPRGHQRSASCWIEGSIGQAEHQIEMMLFVVGLNHSVVGEHAPADAAGVAELVEAMQSAWPTLPERIVVISSAFPPGLGEVMRDEMARRFKVPFELQAVTNDLAAPRFGTLGVIAGSRWMAAPGSLKRLELATNPGQGVASVRLHDTVNGNSLQVFAVHTKDGELSMAEIKELTGHAYAQRQASELTPLIAGDFNMTEAMAPNASAFFASNYGWLNRDVPCSGVGVFSTQQGNLMQALRGRIDAPASLYRFPCASGELERLRFSYSADRSGAPAFRQADKRSAEQEGILIDDIAHNVLALGLRAAPRTTPLPASCGGAPPPPDCCEPGDGEDCTGRALCPCGPKLRRCAACGNRCLAPAMCKCKKPGGEP
jgi:hypothetical protein